MTREFTALLILCLAVTGWGVYQWIGGRDENLAYFAE